MNSGRRRPPGESYTNSSGTSRGGALLVNLILLALLAGVAFVAAKALGLF